MATCSEPVAVRWVAAPHAVAEPIDRQNTAPAGKQHRENGPLAPPPHRDLDVVNEERHTAEHREADFPHHLMRLAAPASRAAHRR